MSLVNIISAIGNNSSVYPLIVRDCGIEVPTKVGLTYKQNLKESKQTAKNALRERLIDEYGTSIIWLGGIPFIDYLCDKRINKMGFNSSINPNLFKEDKEQGIKLNIEKFKNLAKRETSELEKVLRNRKKYERLLAGKFLMSTTIPIVLMGFVLPKFNFKLTKILNDSNNNQEKISFKGLANLSTVNKMAITDGGLTVGRVSTARNNYEKLELAFKMLSMMFLNFVAPIWLAKGLDKLSSKLFKTNVNLDPKMFVDKDLLNSIKNNDIKIPKENFIENLDRPSMFSKLAEKYCGVKYLDNGVRDPRCFVNTNKVKNFSKELEKFKIQALESGNVDKFAKKALYIKSGNILANIAISSFLLAVVLPKLTFLLRKKVTGSDGEPGLIF